MTFIPLISEEASLASQVLEDQLVSVFEAIQKSIVAAATTAASTTASSVNNYSCCGTYLDISTQIPYWVVIEKEEKGGEALTVFDFIQKYYDWLYCEEVCGGSDYLLENKLLDIIDIEKTKQSYRKRLYYSYFPEYRDGEQLSIDGAVVTDDTIAKFVKGIKLKFYVKKGSLESLKYFFKSLFSLEDVLVRYPKKLILRLNAGAFFNSNFNFKGSTYDQTLELENIENEIVGSYLNHNIIQDGSLYTDYSYIVNAGSSGRTITYQDLFKRIIHPAGLNPFLELDIDNYEPPGSTYVDEGNFCENSPLLINYYPYQLNTQYIDEDFFLRISGGVSYYGLTYTRGCTLTGPTINKPCHFFPTWANGLTSYTKFFNIPIREMFKLCRINTNINPNLSIPNCT